MKSSEFKILLMPFSSRLYRLAFSLLGNREEAEDTVQEVYLKLWQMKDDLEKYNSLEALSVRVTRNLCLDQLRKRKRTRQMEEQQQAADIERGEDPAEQMLEKEKAEIMNQMINRLPEPQRSLVYFRHIEGKEYKEIGELMDMKENAIRVSISRARKQLKEMLQNQHASWTDQIK